MFMEINLTIKWQKTSHLHLLKIFNLQERYIDEHTPLENFEVNADIDWNSVNALLQKHKKKSKQFLLNVLEK